MQPPACITGIGVLSALGCSHHAFREALLAGRTGIRPITAFETSGCRSKCGAPLEDFDATRWLSPLKLRRMDETGRLAVVATHDALDDAGCHLGEAGDDRIGVVLGTYTAGGPATSEFLAALLRGGPTGVPALLFSSTVGNAPASLAALEYKLRGPNSTISQKECSGLAAIATAADLIAEGRARAVVAGGVDALFAVFYQVHDRFGVLAARDREVAEASRPFDRHRNGFVLGEGGFGLLLEEVESARARSSRVYGAVLGVGASSVTSGINAWPSDPRALARTMRLALEDAEVDPADVAAIYASANSTVVLDRTEAEAIALVFGSRNVPVTSIKGALGEFGASGAAACAAALLCGEAGFIPPTAGLTALDPACAHLRIPTSAVALAGPLVLVNSFASGGATYSVLLRVGEGP
ncbi:MAG: beta-ketoacyl-[acyl-carrier-protein] synthase family protein [Vicinamibacteraceae bacterium]